MKIFERSKSNTRSMTPKRATAPKPPFPKLIQKRLRPENPTQRVHDNKENLSLDKIVPKDSLLIRPDMISQNLYTQSPLGEIHICFPYELPNKICNLMPTAWDSKNSSQVCATTPSVSRNNRVKLLSKNFKINRHGLIGYNKGLSQNTTPEPKEFE